MALKDWYKVTAGAWRNRQTLKVLIIIQTKESYPNDVPNKYNVSMDGIIIKQNVSRTSALKFVEDYMKKN